MSSSDTVPLSSSRHVHTNIPLEIPKSATFSRIETASIVSESSFACNICRNIRCTLRSHRSHPRNLVVRNVRRRSQPPSKDAFNKSYVMTWQRDPIPPKIITSWIDPWRTLPVDEKSRPLLDASVWTLTALVLTRYVEVRLLS